jgi:hypothetical protein
MQRNLVLDKILNRQLVICGAAFGLSGSEFIRSAITAAVAECASRDENLAGMVKAAAGEFPAPAKVDA